MGRIEISKMHTNQVNDLEGYYNEVLDPHFLTMSPQITFKKK